MLHHLHTTIANLLYDERCGNIPQAEVDVLFEIPNRQWVESLARPALCCYMFDMAEVAEFRNASSQVARANGRAITKLPPRRVDLRYMVCAFSSSRADEQMLVWRAMAVFMKHTTLTINLTKEEREVLRLPDVPITTKLGPYPEAPKVMDLWGALELPPRPALLLSVTAPMDLDLEFDAPLVLTRITRFTRPSADDQRYDRGIAAERVTRRGGALDAFAPQQGVQATEQVLSENLLDGFTSERSLALMERLLRGEEPQEREHTRYRIAGVVHSAHGDPMPQMIVGVMGRAIECETAEGGRFTLANVPVGKAYLWLEPKQDRLDGKPISQPSIEVQIPWAFDIDADTRIARYHIGGVVRDRHGALLERVTISALGHDATCVTGENGRFHLSLPAGPVTVSVARAAEEPQLIGEIVVPTMFDIVLLKDAINGY